MPSPPSIYIIMTSDYNNTSTYQAYIFADVVCSAINSGPAVPTVSE